MISDDLQRWSTCSVILLPVYYFLVDTGHTPGAQARTYFLAIVDLAHIEYPQVEYIPLASA